MSGAIHSMKNTQKQRCKSQNVTQRSQQSMLKTFIERRVHREQPISMPSTKRSGLVNINMLLNGKSIDQININSTPQKKGKTTYHSPKHVPCIKEYIYKKYLTEHQEQLSPHAEGIIRLRQMFNQRVNKGRSCSENREPQEQQVKWPKLQIHKVASLTDPDLNNMTYISRARKYEMQQPLRDRYLRIFRQRQQGKKSTIIPSSVQERSMGLTIDPWQTD